MLRGVGRHLGRRIALVTLTGLGLSGEQQGDGRIAEPFSDVTAVVELSDGRALVLDRVESALFVVDFASGARLQIGRRGEGPGEYRLPWTLHRLAPDTIAMFDRGNRRLLLLSNEARFVGVVTAERFARTTGANTPNFGAEGPQQVDAAGRVYWRTGLFDTRSRIPNQLADSSPVLRIDRTAGRTDTLAWLRRPNVTRSGEAGSRDVAVVGRYAMHFVDDWAVLGDGTLIVLRSPEFDIEVRSPSGRVTRHRGAGTPTPVTAWHRERWLDSAATSFRVSVPVANGVLGPPRVTRGSRRPTPAGWPETVPPFAVGHAVVDPYGSLWVERAPSGAGERRRYDRISAEGLARSPLLLPDSARLVAVTANAVYLTNTDEDGLVFLVRCRRIRSQGDRHTDLRLVTSRCVSSREVPG